MNSLDWTVQAFVDARMSAEALLQPDAVESILKVLDAKAGCIQEDESKLLLRKALFSVERGKEESLRQYTTRRLAQIEAASTAALVTMPTTTWGTVLKEGARLTKQSEQKPQHTLEWQHRACCESTQHAGRGKSGRHHQDTCKTCSALLHGKWNIHGESVTRRRNERNKRSVRGGRRRTLSPSGRNDGRQLDCTDWRRRPQRDRGSRLLYCHE